MPVLLEGSCHCRAVKYTLESNTPVPFMICQCCMCRKIGGYMGTCNMMGNKKTLKYLQGEDQVKIYKAVKKWDKHDKPTDHLTSERSFCSICSSALFNYHPEYPEWIYPFASTIDKPDPLPSLPKSTQIISILRDHCPSHVPLPENAKVYGSYPDVKGIEAWHKENGAWVG